MAITVSLEKPQTPFTGLKQNLMLITVIYVCRYIYTGDMMQCLFVLSYSRIKYLLEANIILTPNVPDQLQHSNYNERNITFHLEYSSYNICVDLFMSIEAKS